ncbi:MAG: hypothetical protein K1X89_18305 [Myxococcaceae bacterium]|nr:hypothetical protein [Myxococcaceae bacterium]
MTSAHPSLSELEAQLSGILQAPRDGGALERIVRRPAPDARETLTEVRLDERDGLPGDDWRHRAGRKTPGAEPSLENQLTLMSSRVAQAVAKDSARWGLAGDQLYVDLDLSEQNLPAGTRLALGEAVLEITAEPHLGCKKFAERFGADALVFVNGQARRSLRLRGVHARVVRSGLVRVGDRVQRLP